MVRCLEVYATCFWLFQPNAFETQLNVFDYFAQLSCEDLSRRITIDLALQAFNSSRNVPQFRIPGHNLSPSVRLVLSKDVDLADC